MGRVYTIDIPDVATTTAKDLVEIQPADDHPVRILALFLLQKTEATGATTEKLRVEVARGNATSGSGGTTNTPTPMVSGDAAASCTVEVNNTTQASTGTRVIQAAKYISFNQGVEMYFPDKMQPQASQADTTMVIELTEAPTASITIGGTVWIEEL